MNIRISLSILLLIVSIGRLYAQQTVESKVKSICLLIGQNESKAVEILGKNPRLIDQSQSMGAKDYYINEHLDIGISQKDGIITIISLKVKNQMLGEEYRQYVDQAYPLLDYSKEMGYTYYDYPNKIAIDFFKTLTASSDHIFMFRRQSLEGY